MSLKLMVNLIIPAPARLQLVVAHGRSFQLLTCSSAPLKVPAELCLNLLLASPLLVLSPTSRHTRPQPSPVQPLIITTLLF